MPNAHRKIPWVRHGTLAILLLGLSWWAFAPDISQDPTTDSGENPQALLTGFSGQSFQSIKIQKDGQSLHLNPMPVADPGASYWQGQIAPDAAPFWVDAKRLEASLDALKETRCATLPQKPPVGAMADDPWGLRSGTASLVVKTATHHWRFVFGKKNSFARGVYVASQPTQGVYLCPSSLYSTFFSPLQNWRSHDVVSGHGAQSSEQMMMVKTVGVDGQGCWAQKQPQWRYRPLGKDLDEADAWQPVDPQGLRAFMQALSELRFATYQPNPKRSEQAEGSTVKLQMTWQDEQAKVDLAVDFLGQQAHRVVTVTPSASVLVQTPVPPSALRFESSGVLKNTSGYAALVAACDALQDRRLAVFQHEDVLWVSIHRHGSHFELRRDDDQFDTPWRLTQDGESHPANASEVFALLFRLSRLRVSDTATGTELASQSPLAEVIVQGSPRIPKYTLRFYDADGQSIAVRVGAQSIKNGEMTWRQGLISRSSYDALLWDAKDFGH